MPAQAGTAGTTDPDPGAAVTPLSTAAEVRALGAQAADRGAPVRLRGVVTFVAGTRAFFFLEDATDGIFVDAGTLVAAGYRVGDSAVVEGVSAAGLFAPQVTLRRYTVLGTGAMLGARPASYSDLASGALDSRLVTLRGTVRSIRPEPARADGQVRFAFDLESGGATFQVRLSLADPAGADKLTDGHLVDATVVLRGVCGGMFNGQRQLVGVVLHAPDVDGVTVVQPPAAEDPFAQAPQPIQSLFQFSPRGRVDRRVRVDGTVVYHQPGGALYIADGASAISVLSAQPGTLYPGDRVQVAGFPAMGGWTPVLEDAQLRRVGTGALPAAVPTTAETESSADAHDARLVTLEAELLDVVDQRPEVALALRAGSVLFDAQIPAPAPLLERGSRLQLTGVSVASVDRLLAQPTSFKLLLRGPADVVVLGRPSIWTLGRVSEVMAGLAGILALVVFWVLVLRRRVREQTEIIRQQLQHELSLEERYRDLFENANDMVFAQDLDGHLTAVNRAAEEMTGYRRAELLARTLYDLVPAPNRDALRETFARLPESDHPPPVFETALCACDGRVVPVEMSVRPTLRRGRAVGAEGIARDISARKRHESELGTAHRRLLDVARQAGMADAASSVLHRIDDVLARLDASAASLAERLRSPQAVDVAEQRAHLDEVEALGRGVEHIREIVAVQQGYARMSGEAEETLPATALVADALRIQTATFARHGIALVREVVADPEVTVDRPKVLQILVNLIGHAASACGAHSGQASRPTITVRLEAAGETRFRIAVRDTGPGIAPDKLSRVLQRGFAAGGEAHGFGLHSAALTARELGGTLTVASDGPGRGATFTLELPTSPELGDKRTTKDRLAIVLAEGSSPIRLPRPS